ncbi:MAG: tetratricopeptide repeat protein [Anaerolineae bacterium]|nr:tetratricopeptide repeat protein [Anaerolineae bacterium]
MNLAQLTNWLGPGHTRLLVTLLVGVGLGSLGLQVAFAGEDWVLTVQLALVWLLFVALAVILGSRLPRLGRRRLVIGLGPGLVLLGLGVLLPDMVLFFGGAGLGWMMAAQFVLRGRVRMEYQTAIRHLRQGEYKEAVAVMDTLIKAEPDTPEHYRFRAELSRLSGRLDRAIADYKRVVELEPDAAVGYTGLAEVHAQQADYGGARAYALQALEREPRSWLAAYNLGLIEDRLGYAEEAVKHLDMALAANMPHRRYHLMARFWRIRNLSRLDRMDDAQQQLDTMRRYAAGVQDWLIIFENAQAAPLRGMLEADVQSAQKLLDGTISPDMLG